MPSLRTLAAATVLFTTPIGCGESSSLSNSDSNWHLERSQNNPIIPHDISGISPEWGYSNVNGPSVVRVPEWLDSPLGQYYMYFAHHRGSYIRLAYSNSVEGPWTVKEGGVFDLADSPGIDHIASPDVLVDHEQQVIRMFYHSTDDTTTWNQNTYLATSNDGLSFDGTNDVLGPPYLRAFQVDNEWWAISKVRGGPGGVLLRSESADGPFEEGPTFLEGMRHGAVHVVGSEVELVFSRIGDSPERLMVTTFDPVQMWDNPYAVELRDLLIPEMDYEGANIPVVSSAVGETTGPVNALRDPYYFVDYSNEAFLFYSVAGENGIGVARVIR